MSHSEKETGKFRSDRIKLMLIPVLLMVLAAVLFWPESATEDTAPVPQLKTTTVKALPTDNNESASATSQLDHQWPSLDLSEVTAVNPFAKSTPIKEMLGELPEDKPAVDRPEAVSQPQNDEIAAADADESSEPPSPRPTEPPEKPEREVIDVATIATLHAIIETDGGRSALINSRIFRVGDLLNDDYRIVEIAPASVFVEWIEPIENGESI